MLEKYLLENAILSHTKNKIIAKAYIDYMLYNKSLADCSIKYKYSKEWLLHQFHWVLRRTMKYMNKYDENIQTYYPKKKRQMNIKQEFRLFY